MVTMKRSPWSGLTPTQALQLSDALGQPAELLKTRREAVWDVHSAFSRRAAVALGSNDLRGALDAAEIACAALRLWSCEGPTEVEGEGEAVVHQHPAAALRSEPGAGSRSAHRPDRALPG